MVVDLAGSELDEDDTAIQHNGNQERGSTGNVTIGGVEMVLPLEQIRLLAPLPRPASLRTFCTFEEHIINLARLSSRAVPPSWYRVPAFSFGNHGAIYGPDADLPMPDTTALDYELGVACIIGREGHDIGMDEALDYIAGYCIINDWCARDRQADDYMPHTSTPKARDFATSLGPWIATPDELEIYTEDDGRLTLTMTARLNQVERSQNNLATMFHTFAEMIAWASRDTTLYPGDILGSGAVGGGSLLEGTDGYGPWLERGDIVELEVTGLGTLHNRIV
jgi:fumarylacetoacetate (FAA) hydrolase